MFRKRVIGKTLATVDDELAALKEMLDNQVIDDSEYAQMCRDAENRHRGEKRSAATAAATATAPDFSADTRTTVDAGGKRSATTKTERTYHATKTGSHSTVISGSDTQSKTSSTASGKKSKNVAAVLALFLGAFGAQKWYLGYTKEALIICAITFLGSFLGGFYFMMLLGLAEFFIYLTRSPEEFERTYVEGHKGWF